MPLKQIRLDAEVLRLAEQQKPSFLETSQYIGLLVQKALTGVDPLNTLGARPAGAGSLSLAVNKEEEERARAELINRPPTPVPAKPPKDPFSRKAITEDLIPDDLKENPHLDELLIDFWHVKKGTRSERAFNGLVTKLRAMTPSDQIKALQEAYNGGWATVYQPKPDTPQQGKWQQPEPEMKHPAYRDAREIIAEQETKWKNIPSATGGRGVLEFLSES